MIRDPLAAALLGRGTYYGKINVEQPAVLITPEERDLFVKRLSQDRESMVCVNCGSTQRLSFYAMIQAKTCCDARKMVDAKQILAQLAAAQAQVAGYRRKAKAARKRTKA